MRKPHWKPTLVLVVFVLIVLPHTAAASVTRSQSFQAVKLTQDPPLDATLADPVWQKAVTATGFVDITTRRPAPLSTTAYLLYDNTNVYVAFKANQDGVPIRASQTTNNIGFGQDDAVGVGIDTSGAGSNVYFFEATPRGVRYQQSAESTRYAPTWEAKTAVNGSSWNALLIIPLKDLRAAGGVNRTWRFNFIRIVAGVGEHYTWAYDGVMQDAQPPTYPFFTDARFWPALTNLDLPKTAAKPPPRAEIYGLSSVGQDRNIFQQANNTFAPQPVRNYGVDFVVPFTGTMALVGTLDPDFSNVEVDQQTIAPQEFPRNLTEYRPFFAQGANFLNPNIHLSAGSQVSAPNQVFYSPSIGTFDRGFKVEGTYGNQGLGVLQLRGLTGDNQALDDQAFGYQHALSDRTFLYWIDGVLAHHADVGNDSTEEFGVEGRNLSSGLVWIYDQTLEQSAFVANPDQTFAYTRVEALDVHKPNYEVLADYSDISPNYGPLDGFTNYADARGPVYVADFTTSSPGLKSWNGFATVDRFLTRTGQVKAADFFATTDFTTRDLVHITLQQQTSSLDDPTLTGGINEPFHTSQITLGYRDGTPTPFDASFSEGPFSNYYLQQFNISSTSPLGPHFNLQAVYAGAHQRSDAIGVNGQILRSLGIGESFGPETSVTFALRSINGTGGFATPGLNFAAGFHARFQSGSELFLNWGSPNATATLNRFITKFVWRIGGGAGT